MMAESSILSVVPTSIQASTSPQTFRLPDPLASYPWKRFVNPYYEVCKAESSAWAESFGAFGPKAQAAFNKCDFSKYKSYSVKSEQLESLIRLLPGLLAALVFPKLNRDGCRVGCDLMMVFFVFDDWSDISTVSETRKQADAIMDALYRPEIPRPKDEWIGGELTRQFWLNACRTASETSKKRFIETFKGYTDAVVEQSRDRDDSRVRDIASYFEVRRLTVGAKPSFAIHQLHYDVPDSFLEHPTVVTLTILCIDMIIMGNDYHSYNVEQSRGDEAHNIVTVVMNELSMGLQDAMDYVGRLYHSHIRRFLEAYGQISEELGKTNHPMKANALSYIESLGNWVRGNDQWSFEETRVKGRTPNQWQTERYYGSEGLRIYETREVTLLPKKICPPLED